MSVWVNEDVGAPKANTGEDFDRRRDDLLGDVLDRASTILEAFLCQFLLPNCFVMAFSVPVCDVLVLPF